MWVSWRRRSSRPRRSAPPPASMMPRSTMSAASSGGVRQAAADRCRQRLLDERHLARAGGDAGLVDGALLDVGGSRGSAHHDAWMCETALSGAPDEVAEHLLGDLEVGDHSVAQGAD